MSRLCRWLVCGVGAGAVVGLMAGVRWIVAVAAAGGPGGDLIATVRGHGLLFACSFAIAVSLLLRMAPKQPARGVARALLAVAGGSVACLGATKMMVALAVSGAISAEAQTWTAGFRRLTGDQIARQGLNYAPPPGIAYHLSIILSLSALGLCVGAVSGLCAGRIRWARRCAVGTAMGAIVGLYVALVQTQALIVAMRAGQHPASVVGATTVAWSATGLIAALTGHGWTHREAPRMLRAAPVGGALIAIAYIFGGLYGYPDYATLGRLHPDGAYTYLQFRCDGSWRRTLDQAACNNRTRLAQDFVMRYANSAYRPAAELAAAQSLFEEWRFKEAADTLRQANQEYPLLAGYRDVLWACADLASGRAGTMLRTTGVDSDLARWRGAVGAQTAADAAARLGLPRRAYGLHSAYLDYLSATQRSAWFSESGAFSKSAMDALPYRKQRGLMRGTVEVAVMGPDGPVRGARVALVQPHPNAAFPEDSAQFTGAWTIPAWNGSWSTTNGHGVAVIRDALYGAYEVVVGMSPGVWPAGTVAVEGPAGVLVRTSRTVCPAIRLVPAVQIITPRDGAIVSPKATLRWRAYPRAAHYSVSVIEVSPSAAQARGTTCWARTGIAGPQTTLDPEHCIGGRRIQGGRCYMWAVYAYGQDGRLVSSSEHYFELREATFTIRVPGARKGGLPR